MSARWAAFWSDPFLVWVWVALAFALVSWLTLVGLPRYWAWADRRRSVQFFDAVAELPLEVYRPEDVLIGIDVAPATGRETVVVAQKQADGRLHIVMAHERTVDDE